MINFDGELTRIFGRKYQGCTQTNDELVEYRLKPGKVATPSELAQVAALPKGMRAEIDELKAKYDNLKVEVEKLKAGAK